MASPWAAWSGRAAWIIAAIAGGAAVEGAVEGRSEAIRWLAGIGSWIVWGVVMLSLALPSVRSLTIARIGSPLALVAAVAVAIGGATAIDVAWLAIPAIVACVAIFTANLGRRFVQSSSYGDEDRFPLRIPVAAGSAAVILWFVWASAIVAGPLLVAARSWALGLPLTGLGVAGVVFLVPRWHRLSRRWLVFVPAGIVVHDPVVLADTLMVRTEQILGLGLAATDTEAADLTGPASGYAIEVRAADTVTAVFAFTPNEPSGRAIHMTGFLIAPSRPGEALRTAAARGLHVA